MKAEIARETRSKNDEEGGDVEMNLFVFDRPKFDRLYNCGYDVDVIPLESRRDVPHGLFHIAMFVLLEVCCFHFFS